MTPVVKAARYPDYAASYALAYSADRPGVPVEGGSVSFAWDEQGLYVAAELQDSCIVAHNREDQQFHFQSGDVFELFVKPLDDSYYWEMYAIPPGNKTTLYFPRDREGLKLHDFLHGHGFNGLVVDVEEISGGWRVEMFVPAEQLTAAGAGWGDGTEWTVCCGRYNYNNETLEDPELSMVPVLSRTDYHLVDEYARLHMVGLNAALPAELESACDTIA